MNKIKEKPFIRKRKQKQKQKEQKIKQIKHFETTSTNFAK